MYDKRFIWGDEFAMKYTFNKLKKPRWEKYLKTKKNIYSFDGY